MRSVVDPIKTFLGLLVEVESDLYLNSLVTAATMAFWVSAIDCKRPSLTPNLVYKIETIDLMFLFFDSELMPGLSPRSLFFRVHSLISSFSF